MKIALVYDWMDSWGGIERVLLTVNEMIPRADWYTSVFDVNKASWANKLQPRTSFIQLLPSFIKKSRKLSTPFYPFAFESFDFSDYDIVLSVTSSFAKGIITGPNTKHISYFLTPPRYFWTHRREYQTNIPVLQPYLTYLKKWDTLAAHRPDIIIAISKTVQDRITKTYNLASQVIYPPFDIEYWERFKSHNASGKKQAKSRYYLVVSRLEPYKRVDLVINAFNHMLDRKLLVVGDGTLRTSLARQARENIHLLGHVPDKTLATLYQDAKALVMPQEEDFGMVALEAQFFGCPVIAYNKGGVTETARDGITAIFFDSQTVGAIQSAIAKYEKIAYTLKKSTEKLGPESVKKFGKKSFVKEFGQLINANLNT